MGFGWQKLFFLFASVVSSSKSYALERFDTSRFKAVEGSKYLAEGPKGIYLRTGDNVDLIKADRKGCEYVSSIDSTVKDEVFLYYLKRMSEIRDEDLDFVLCVVGKMGKQIPQSYVANLSKGLQRLISVSPRFSTIHTLFKNSNPPGTFQRLMQPETYEPTQFKKVSGYPQLLWGPNGELFESSGNIGKKLNFSNDDHRLYYSNGSAVSQKTMRALMNLYCDKLDRTLATDHEARVSLLAANLKLVSDTSKRQRCEKTLVDHLKSIRNSQAKRYGELLARFKAANVPLHERIERQVGRSTYSASADQVRFDGGQRQKGQTLGGRHGRQEGRRRLAAYSQDYVEACKANTVGQTHVVHPKSYREEWGGGSSSGTPRWVLFSDGHYRQIYDSTPQYRGAFGWERMHHTLSNINGNLTVDATIDINYPDTQNGSRTDLIRRMEWVRQCVIEFFQRHQINLRLKFRHQNPGYGRFPSGANTVNVHWRDPRYNVRHWSFHQKQHFHTQPLMCTGVAHEVGHLFGLYDEYVDKRVPNRKIGEPDNIMREANVPTAQVRFYPRQLRTILRDLCG